MKLRLLLIPSTFILVILLGSGESQNLQRYVSLDSSEIRRLTSALSPAEPRQMGLLGFTALGAMMFPILVSLGMASFVSHLPTVFKEFATEFGIPSTPPRNFFFFRRKRSDFNAAYEDHLEAFLKNFLSNLVEKLEENNHQNFQKL